MKGKFIGKTSMGFVTGKMYDVESRIQIVRRGGVVFGENVACICIYDKYSDAWCPYQTLEAVIDNWMFNK